MTRRWRSILWTLAFGVAAILVCAPLARTADDTCAVCHEDAVKAFSKSNHGRAFAGDQSLGGSCTSCHGPTEAHLEANGAGHIINPRKAPASQANATCLTCHDGKPGQAHWQGSAHEQAGNKCVSCHDVHARVAGTPVQVKSLSGTADTTQKCLECHGQIRASLHQRSSHPMADGQLTCASCHNPHGSAGEKLLRKGSVNDLCYSCHQQLRGPFLWEHSPVREDCLTCHQAHGSNYPSLLVARTTQLCNSCHQQGRHQTIPGVPPSVWLSNKACLNCHSQIHGTNHPSGPLFQR